MNGFRRSIATVSLSGTLEEKLGAVALAGFDGIELFEGDLLGCPWSPSEVRKRCDDLGLGVELYQPVRDLEAVPRARHQATLSRAKEKLALAAELGADTILACSNVAADALDDDDLVAEDLHELGMLAGEHGVRLAYEALAWGRHIKTYRHAWRVVKAADHPSVGLCIDSFHVLSIGDSLASIDEVSPEKLFFLQLADAPYIAMDLLRWSRHHRCFPGQGAFDLVGFTGDLVRAGYRGPLSLEIFNDVVRRSDANATAIDAMRSLVALEDGLSRDRRGLGTAEDEVVAARQLPPGEVPIAVVGVGLRGDASTTVGIEQILAAAGFSDQPVEAGWHERRWRLGHAAVSVGRDQRLAGTGGNVVDRLRLGFRTPASVADRARALLASTHRGEADLDEVRAPDGRSMALVPVTEDAGEARSPLLGIDHVVLSVGEGEFDESMLFYRSVLLLEAQANEELAAPDGLVRSRALAAPRRVTECPVRIALNAGGDGAGHEHVAFACRDLLSLAQDWRRSGVPILAIPSNYYQDLKARWQLSEERISQLAALDVLYDVDGAGNELLHCYTTAVEGRFFFELVQRCGAYDGYGASNASVRMTAQRWRQRAAAAG